MTRVMVNPVKMAAVMMMEEDINVEDSTAYPNDQMKSRIRILFIPLLLLPVLVHSQSYQTRSGHAEFHSTVPLHTFTGESDFLTGVINFEENLVDFYLDLSTLKTGNSRRDRDMYRTLNVDEYPFAEFTGTLETPFDVNSAQKQAVIAKGQFTIHGITVEKTVEGTLQRQGNNIVLEAEWVQDITEHNIEPPGILFYRVRDEMDVQIRAVLEPENDES